MSQRIKTTKNKKRRLITYLWILALAVGVFLLIYFERTELLYILATLGVTALLIIVAIADLGMSEKPQSSQLPDAQAAGSGISSKLPKK
jgi:amino acid permease